MFSLIEVMFRVGRLADPGGGSSKVSHRARGACESLEVLRRQVTSFRTVRHAIHAGNCTAERSENDAEEPRGRGTMFPVMQNRLPIRSATR